MKSTKEKKINLFKLNFSVLALLTLMTYSCTKSLEHKLIGNWEIEAVSWEGDEKIEVPSEDRYFLQLKKSNGKLIFSDDEQKGTWSIEDSILSLESIPVCTTYVDSIFLINDAFGNSSLMLKNGDQKLGIVSSNGIEPEKVIYSMNLLYVNQTSLELYADGHSYFYKKIR